MFDQNSYMSHTIPQNGDPHSTTDQTDIGKRDKVKTYAYYSEMNSDVNKKVFDNTKQHSLGPNMNKFNDSQQNNYQYVHKETQYKFVPKFERNFSKSCENLRGLNPKYDNEFEINSKERSKNLDDLPKPGKLKNSILFFEKLSK